MSFSIKSLVASAALLLATVSSAHAQIADAPTSVRPLLNGLNAPLQAQVQRLTGEKVELKQLIAGKPTVLVFYRGGWCPYCNAQLSGLRTIEKPLADAGYQLIALSPEPIDAAAKVRAETDKAPLSYQLYSDAGLQAMQAFGIAYYMDAKTEAIYRQSYGIKLTYDASGKAVLPAPAVFILGADGVIQFSYVHVNYKTRLAPELLLHAAQLAAKPQTK